MCVLSHATYWNVAKKIDRAMLKHNNSGGRLRLSLGLSLSHLFRVIFGKKGVTSCHFIEL